MARDGIVSALQPMSPPAKLTYSNGAGAATGPGYGAMGRQDPIPMSGYTGPGGPGYAQGNGFQFSHGYFGPARQSNLGPGFMGENEVGMYGARPMGFMQPMGFWGGSGGWGSHMSMPTPQPIAAPTGYGSDSDAHGSSAGLGGGLW